jgi:hypothetical protein
VKEIKGSFRISNMESSTIISYSTNTKYSPKKSNIPLLKKK